MIGLNVCKSYTKTYGFVLTDSDGVKWKLTSITKRNLTAERKHEPDISGTRRYYPYRWSGSIGDAIHKFGYTRDQYNNLRCAIIQKDESTLTYYKLIMS